jgi:hypothetical protein
VGLAVCTSQPYHQPLAGIFVPGKPPPADVLNAAIDILTAATTVPLAPLHDPDHATAMLQSHQGPPGPDGNTDGPHDNGWHGDSVDHGHEGGHGPQGGWGNHYHYHQNTSGLAPDSAEQAGIEEATRSALKGVLVMGSKAGGRLSEDDMTLLQQVSMGPADWCRLSLELFCCGWSNGLAVIVLRKDRRLVASCD